MSCKVCGGPIVKTACLDCYHDPDDDDKVRPLVDLDGVIAQCFIDYDVDEVLEAIADFLGGYGEGIAENYRDDANFTAAKRVETAYGFAVPAIRAVAEGFKNG